MKLLRLIREHRGPFRQYLRGRPASWRELLAIAMAFLAVYTLFSPVATWVKVAAAAAFCMAVIELYWHAIDGYRESRSSTYNRDDIWKD